MAPYTLDNTTHTHNVEYFLFSLPHDLHNKNKNKYFVALHSVILCECVGVDIVDGNYPELWIGVFEEHASIPNNIQYCSLNSKQ